MPYRTPAEVPEKRWIDNFDLNDEVVRELLLVAELANIACLLNPGLDENTKQRAQSRAEQYRLKAWERSEGFRHWLEQGRWPPSRQQKASKET